MAVDEEDNKMQDERVPLQSFFDVRGLPGIYKLSNYCPKLNIPVAPPGGNFV